MIRLRQSRLLSFLVLFASEAALVGCDAEPPLLGEAEPDAPTGPGQALACPAGTHAVHADPEIGGGGQEGVCEPDTVCGDLDCGTGSCREEGSVAACWCPEGYEGDACGGCAEGYETDGEGSCAAAGAGSLPSGELSFADGSVEPSTALASGGHRVEFGTCGSGSGCADEIPMTGTVSKLFEEVDIAMAQFVKTRCAGSAVLAVSRGDRRIYKRGFGKESGSAAPNLSHCSSAASGYSSSARNTLPDTPHQIGSVSKYVTSALVREQIEERIAARGLGWKYGDASEALLLDPDLELLPPSLLRYLDQTRSDAVCPEVVASGSCPRSGCGGNGPDTRWQNMTVGDLIGHTSGIVSGAMPSWDDVIVNAGALRGYNSKSDWQADHTNLRARTKFPTELDAGREYLAGKLGADIDDIMFVSTYDARAGEDPVDETIKVTAGRCLTDSPIGQTDDNPSDADFGYQNGVYAILGRVSAHLSGEAGGDYSFSSPTGFPELHEGSALDAFLVQHGIEDGIVAEHSIQNRVTGRSPGLTDPVPVRREYQDGTYTPRVAAKSRPFCVWTGSSCDFTPWDNDVDNAVGLRMPWDFAFGYLGFENGGVTWVNKPVSIPHYYNTAGRNPATGGLMAEASALLRISNLYRAERKDVHQGLPRDGCGVDCSGTSMKGGDMGGARARVRQMAGGSISPSLPPRDGNGHLRTEPNPGNWTSAAWTEPTDVDFVAAVSQSADESGFNGYQMERYVSYALSRVDWEAVDVEIETESRRVVGLALNASSRTYTWYADDHREAKFGVPGAPGGQSASPGSYSLPSARVGSDVVGAAISPGGEVFAWYDDGHRSTGQSRNLGANDDVMSYSLPPGQTYEDIVGISMASNLRVYSWYRDGTRAIGRSWDLDAYGVGSYSLPPGQTADEIVGVAIDWADDSHVYTQFRDGSVSEGTSWRLDNSGYVRGEVAGMSMFGGDTTQWFANGYMRRMEGTPAENMETPDILEARDYEVAPGYEPADVIATAEIDDGGVRFWYSDGKSSWGTNTAGNPTYPNWPTTNHSFVVGMGRSTDGRVFSWYNTGARAVGTSSNLGSEDIRSSYQAPQHHFNIAAVAIDSSPGGDGRVWALYRDGAVSRGRSWNLGQTVWDAL